MVNLVAAGDVKGRDVKGRRLQACRHTHIAKVLPKYRMSFEIISETCTFIKINRCTFFWGLWMCGECIYFFVFSFLCTCIFGYSAPAVAEGGGRPPSASDP